jgi:hypothetical protein
MADDFIHATIALAAVAAVISLGLLITFLASYRRVRAPFTAGLVMVAAFFLAQNLLLVYAFLTMMADLTVFVAQLLTVVMAFGCIALGVLLYTSQK